MVTQLESRFAEKDLDVVGDTKFAMSQQCALAAKAAKGILHGIRESIIIRMDPPSLLSTGGNTWSTGSSSWLSSM